MALPHAVDIAPAAGKLGVLLPGMGAVGTTFIAGVLAIRKGLAKPIGIAHPDGHRSASAPAPTTTSPLIKDYVPARRPRRPRVRRLGRLPRRRLRRRHARRRARRAPARAARRRAARHQADAGGVRAGVRHATSTATTSSPAASKMELAEAAHRRHPAVQRRATAATAWSPCGAARPRSTASPPRSTSRLEAFEQGLRDSTPTSPRARSTPTPSSSWASRWPTAPRTSASTSRRCSSWPAQNDVADHRQGLQDRPDPDEDDPRPRASRPGMLGVEGWYSTNILGNRDGEVLDDPESFKAKEVSKLGVLDTIFEPERNPDLYGDIHHVVRINYYPPRGDNKEGWDNIDIFGWLGYKMQIKIDFLCRDSILAAPIVLDLALFLDLAQRAGMTGVQEWLSFYWKSPQPVQRGRVPRARPVHPAHEAEEHPAPPQGRRADHPPRRRILRLSVGSRRWVTGRRSGGLGCDGWHVRASHRAGGCCGDVAHRTHAITGSGHVGRRGWGRYQLVRRGPRSAAITAGWCSTRDGTAGAPARRRRPLHRGRPRLRLGRVRRGLQGVPGARGVAGPCDVPRPGRNAGRPHPRRRRDAEPFVVVSGHPGSSALARRRPRLPLVAKDTIKER